MSLDSRADRRIHFAKWLTSPENAYVRAQYSEPGVGKHHGQRLADPVDDVRATNPASNEELFAALCERLRRARLRHQAPDPHHHELGRIPAVEPMPTPPIKDDNLYYSKYIDAPVAGEVMLDAMSQVPVSQRRSRAIPSGTRALQLPDSQVKSEYLTVFGRPPA